MSEELHQIEVKVSGAWQTVKVTKEQLEKIRSGTTSNARIEFIAPHSPPVNPDRPQQ